MPYWAPSSSLRACGVSRCRARCVGLLACHSLWGGSAVIAANAQGKVSAWEAGNKLVVWDVLSFGFFVAVVVAILFYLAIRERHRLFHWRYGARATMKSDSLEHSNQGTSTDGLWWLGWSDRFCGSSCHGRCPDGLSCGIPAESDEGGGSDESSDQMQRPSPKRKVEKRQAKGEPIG